MFQLSGLDVGAATGVSVGAATDVSVGVASLYNNQEGSIQARVGEAGSIESFCS